MADLLESTCYEVLCLLLESVEPALPDGRRYLRHELAAGALAAFVDALRKRGSSVVLRPHRRLRHRLFDLAQLILLTDVGELAANVDDLVFDLLDLCRALQPDPARPLQPDPALRENCAADRRVRIAFNRGSSAAFADADRATDAKRCGAPGEPDRNKGYLKIGYLLEAYVRCGNAGRRADVWCHVESVVSEFVVRDRDRSCVALRRRLDEVAQMLRIMAVVEGGTPLRRFLRPQIDDIFAALKEDALETRISLADRVRLARRRIRRWLQRLLLRLLRCLRCTLITAAAW